MKNNRNFPDILSVSVLLVIIRVYKIKKTNYFLLFWDIKVKAMRFHFPVKYLSEGLMLRVQSSVIFQNWHNSILPEESTGNSIFWDEIATSFFWMSLLISRTLLWNHCYIYLVLNSCGKYEYLWITINTSDTFHCIVQYKLWNYIRRVPGLF